MKLFYEKLLLCIYSNYLGLIFTFLLKIEKPDEKKLRPFLPLCSGFLSPILLRNANVIVNNSKWSIAAHLLAFMLLFDELICKHVCLCSSVIFSENISTSPHTHGRSFSLCVRPYRQQVAISFSVKSIDYFWMSEGNELWCPLSPLWSHLFPCLQ